MKLFLARHCESEGNLLRRFISQGDHYPLTTRGRAQAKALATRLGATALRPGPFLASPALRAVETARLLVPDSSPRRLALLEELREVNVGELEGRSEDEDHAMSVFHEVVTRMAGGEREVRFPGGGESLGDVVGRATRVKEHLAETGDEVAVVVSHCLFLCGLIPVLTGRDVLDYQGSYVTKGAVSILEGRPGNMEIRVLGDSSHQPEEIRSGGGPYRPPDAESG